MELWQIVLLVIIIILVILFLWWYFSNSSNKISGFKNAATQVVVHSDQLARSANFTLSGWFYVERWNVTTDPKILYKRVGSNKQPGAPYPFTVSFDDTENNIIVKMPTNEGVTQCRLNNFPLQTWVNLIISVQGRSVDLYMQGKLVRTCVLPQPSTFGRLGPLFITPNNRGWPGYTSNIVYYPNPVNPQQAYDIYRMGPGIGSWDIFDKYRLKLSYLVDGEPEWEFEI